MSRVFPFESCRAGCRLPAFLSQVDRIMIRRTILVLIGLLMTTLLLRAQQAGDAPTDVVTRLAEQLEHGQTTLEYREGRGYLPSLLEHLDLNVDSQVLVFSKTSFQQAIISPKNPRALYFNDNVAVGTVPGRLFRIAGARTEPRPRVLHVDDETYRRAAPS